jgi:glycosyltransferase involved in cell wall biosynthesis
MGEYPLKKLPVSVLIPTYNRPHTLAEALESILRQTIHPEEIIVVNDAGHSVNEVAVLYSELNIKVVNMPVNCGHVAVRNQGLNHVTQPWIMLLDDDDLILPDHLETLWSFTEEADFIYADAEVFDYRMDGLTRIPIARKLFAYSFDQALLRKFNTIISSGALYRRSLHDKLGRFDEGVKNYWDWDWCLRVAAVVRIKRVARATTLYAYSPNGDNVSANLDEKRNRIFSTFCAKHQLGELPTMNFFLMLEQPELKAYESLTEIKWDGQPVYTRFHSVS